MAYPAFIPNGLFPSPIDPAFLLGDGFLATDGNATYHMGAPAAQAILSSTGAYRCADPPIEPTRTPLGLLVWPMLWGPGQRGLLLLPPQLPT